MKNFISAFIMLLILFVSKSNSQITPDISSWKINLNGATGYNGILADVQQVSYSANYTYVKSTGIPSYTIGPWNMNPNLPTNQNWVFKIPRFPVFDPTPTVAGNGPLGVLINGVVIFNSGDAMSYNNQNIWHRVAQYFESVSFDTSGGHPAPGGAYHYHINMKKLYTPNASEHSPILGYMYDGYPLYGPYGYSNTNGTGGIRRMKSGYKKRNITTRTTLPNGSVLSPSQYGPAISSTYPLGCFIEDYELVTSGADLDSHNGRFSVTPEYPAGKYSYFIDIDSSGNPQYPYIIGPTYYGEVVTGNGHVTISESVTQYNPRQLTLTILLQGFYNDSLNTTAKDSVRIFLRSNTSPYAVVDSAKAKIDSNGTGTFTFTNAANSVSYYLQINHRNSIETWSTGGNTFVSSLMTYDFTTAINKAYGNNLTQADLSPLKFAIFSGDINQDRIVDASDLSAVENDANVSLSGYVNTDLTGDDFVDGSDVSIVENNAALGFSAITP